MKIIKKTFFATLCFGYLFSILFSLENATNRTQVERVKSVVKTANSYFTSMENPDNFGKLEDVRNDPSKLKPFLTVVSRKSNRPNPSDQEGIDVFDRYFWGMRNGIVLELGALNGRKYSESLGMVGAGWHRILIEASPYFSSHFEKFSPDSYSFGTAICEEDTKLHFKDQAATGGIIEFMPQSLIDIHHQDIKSTPKHMWKTLPFVYEIECLPLHAILKHTRVQHINFFILDVEGAELSVLKTIKFDNIIFDVITIETDPENRPPGYADKVTAYLAPYGYNKVWVKGRNTWYTYKDFIPIPRDKTSVRN